MRNRLKLQARKLIFLAVPLLLLAGASLTMAPAATAPSRPKGPCDVYAAASAPCAAAHSTTRALYAAYNGPLYQVMRQSDGRKQNIGVVAPSAAPVPDAGGYADAPAQDRFCANTLCWITVIYDQSPMHNDLFQAPRGAFSGPAMGGFNNIPIADMAPITIMGHKAYGVFIAPGMGLRRNDAKGTAVDDQAEGQYWVIDGQHYNSGCCFDYGNAEIDSKDDGNGTMETTYYGNATAWYHGNPPGPWVMTDQENNLVGCVNPGSTSKVCPTLPNITWRFVTAMAKGEPHRWASLGGDSQKGPLQVMFDGPRVDVTYDPMRKQGAILLGNGGDNSVASQGTFYEGAMTAANTYPSDATDQLVQANVVAAAYDLPRLTVAPAAQKDAPPGLQSFIPGTPQDTAVTFTNTTGVAVTGLRLSLSLPRGWTATASGVASFAAVAPGASVSATFRLTSGPAAFNGDLTAVAAYTASGAARTDRMAQRVRNGSAVRINEFRISDGTANTANSFIELYNGGAEAVDVSGWSLTQHQTQQAVFGGVTIPANTRVAARGFYLFGLSGSGLAAPARAGDRTLYVRSTDGLKAGDSVTVGSGASAETRRIASVGTAASAETTLWQPAEDPMLTVPVGARSVPVASIAGFAVGDRIAIGTGATYPAVSRSTERHEVATVTAVGKPGTQGFLGTDAPVGATNISVTSVSGITAGDRIRLDIESVGHGIETVTVRSVGTPANWLALLADTSAGATRITVRPGTGVFNGAAANGGPGVAALAVGQKLVVGMPDKLETVTITAVTGNAVDVRPALARAHLAAEPVVEPGTGLTLAAPLKFKHAGNLPFSNRGSGISFTPATAFAHSSNEPVQALGSGITLDAPLARAHAVNTPLRGSAMNTGYQGTPDQWFGGPVLSTAAGSMVLRDAAGRVADSLNYGLLVDPFAAEGYHRVSGTGAAACRALPPGVGRGGGGRGAPTVLNNASSGRLPDGRDSDSNCTDFVMPPATILPEGAAAGTANIKVAGVTDFAAGQALTIDSGANAETATIAAVGTAGVTRTGAALAVGATVIPVATPGGFVVGQAIAIERETATVAAIAGGRGGASITVAAPLTMAHPAGAMVSGTGITLSGALSKAHAAGAQVNTDLPTPGAPNKYVRR